MDQPFTLQQPKNGRKSMNIVLNDTTRQGVLFTGADCLSGQRELFDGRGIDLQTFCGSEADSDHYCFTKPFVMKSWRYATSKHLLIRVPAPGERDTERDGLHFPNGACIAAQAGLDDIPDDTFVTTWPEGNLVQVSWGAACVVGESRIRPAHNRLIMTLSNVRWIPANWSFEAIAFHFDGGQGLVMPVQD